VANNVTKQLSAWDELRGMLMAEGNKLGLVHLECAQLFSLDDAGFILTLEGLNAYLDGPVGKKKKYGAFAPGPSFEYKRLFYENTRAVSDDHRAEEGMSFLSYLDIDIPQTQTLRTAICAAFVSAVRLYVQGDGKGNNAPVSHHFKRLEAHFNPLGAKDGSVSHRSASSHPLRDVSAPPVTAPPRRGSRRRVPTRKPTLPGPSSVDPRIKTTLPARSSAARKKSLTPATVAKASAHTSSKRSSGTDSQRKGAVARSGKGRRKFRAGVRRREGRRSCYRP